MIILYIAGYSDRQPIYKEATVLNYLHGNVVEAKTEDGEIRYFYKSEYIEKV